MVLLGNRQAVTFVSRDATNFNSPTPRTSAIVGYSCRELDHHRPARASAAVLVSHRRLHVRTVGESRRRVRSLHTHIHTDTYLLRVHAPTGRQRHTDSHHQQCPCRHGSTLGLQTPSLYQPPARVQPVPCSSKHSALLRFTLARQSWPRHLCGCSTIHQQRHASRPRPSRRRARAASRAPT